MKTIYDSKFKTDVLIVGQGEFDVSNSGLIMTTTLGSCISVCLHDPIAKVGGMNHYMLPEPAIEHNAIVFEKAKYGIGSMEILINELMKVGANRTKIQAKVFGGANMFGSDNDISSAMKVGEQNIIFAKKYLAAEKIEIVSIDVGGDSARKIYFDTKYGNVKLFRISSKDHELEKEESSYFEKIRNQSIDQNHKKITFF